MTLYQRVQFHAHMKLVQQIMDASFRSHRRHRDDLKQEGYLALNIAVLKFDGDLQDQFEPYASTCIYNALTKYVKRQNKEGFYRCPHGSKPFVMSLSTVVDEVEQETLGDTIPDRRCVGISKVSRCWTEAECSYSRTEILDSVEVLLEDLRPHEREAICTGSDYRKKYKVIQRIRLHTVDRDSISR